MNTVGFKPFEEVVEEVIELMSRRDKILIVGEIGAGKTTFLQTMKSRLGTDNIVYMDEGEIKDSFFNPNGIAMATINAGTPEDGIRLFAEKLGLSDSTRIEGLKGVVFLTYQHLGKFIQAKDCRLPVRKGRNELIEEMTTDFIRKAADNDFSILELEKAIERLKLYTGSLKVVL